MLGTSDLVGFVATADRAAARRFYETVLGLRLVEDSPFALAFDVNGTPVRGMNGSLNLFSSSLRKQGPRASDVRWRWIPAFAGMTNRRTGKKKQRPAVR